MKNRVIKTILIIFYLLFFSTANAENEFIFESNSIEYKENDNLIIAKGDVKVISSNEIDIFADESKYFKDTKKLLLLGNVRLIDKKRGIKIESNEIKYDRKEEKIESDNKTKIYLDDDYEIQTSKLIYLRLQKILKSNKDTTLIDYFNNKIMTNDFIYFANDKKFKSKNLKIIDKDLNEYTTNESFIDLNTNKIAAKDVKIYFSKNDSFGENSRLKGNSMISDLNTTTIQKGIFTSCKPNDDCPPWSMESETITHNKKKQTIEYKNAWLRLYDKPVFYFPKFFHPDPTVKRQSGFLIPSVATSANSGNSIKIPYFNALADNKDFTFSPRLYFNNDVLIQNEYRQIERNSNHIADFSLKKLDDGTKSHFFSNSKINLNTSNFLNSNLEINLEKTSNDTYLKSEELKNSIQNNQSLLNSFVKYNAFRDDIDFSLEVASYEDLTKEKNSDKYQFILPSFKFSKIFKPETDIKGSLRFDASGVSQKRSTNITENYLINDIDFTSDRFFSKNGFVSNFNFIFKNVSKEGKNSDEYSNKFKNENFMSSNYTLNFPLQKETDNFNSSLSPKLSLRYSPFDNENISKLDRQINTTNIFSNNRLGLTDSLEGGQSFTLGFDYELFEKDDKKIFSSSLGQIFRDKNDLKLPKTSKMQNKSSDIVGQFTYTPTNDLEINYNYSADNGLDTMNYNFLETKFNINNFVTSFEFLEENNDIGSDSYFSKNIGYNLNENNMLKYTTRRNRKTDLTEYYNLIYEYKNDCLVAAIEYNKNYYEDRDIRAKEEVFFSLTITPFSSIKSTNINK